ncbi:hypothetical protein [Streptomyces sp. NPDC001568]
MGVMVPYRMFPVTIRSPNTLGRVALPLPPDQRDHWTIGDG